jgi:uncharacterized membrane protein
MRPPDSSRRARATGVASLLVLGLGLTALFAGIDWFWVIFAVGFAAVVPLVSLLVDDESPDRTAGGSATLSSMEAADADADADDPLATLRERYARGDLTDEQFERKLEALLETETLEAAAERDRRRTDDPTDGSAAGRVGDPNADADADADADGDGDRHATRETE